MRPDQTEHFPPVRPAPRRDTQAFPCQQGHTPDGEWNQSFEPGMTYRQWLAGQALLALPNDLRSQLVTDHRIKIAHWCWGMADAMIKVGEEGI